MVLVTAVIAYQEEPLAEAVDRSLKLWLSKSERETLEKVVRALVQRHECDATKHAIEAKDWENFIHKAHESFSQAQRYQTFLDVLAELKGQTNVFSTLKLS